MTDMNFNLFSIIAASAISASVALPASASVEVNDKKAHSTQTYTTIFASMFAHTGPCDLLPNARQTRHGMSGEPVRESAGGGTSAPGNKASAQRA
ncbi:hypothetical protein AO354_07400 [Pseudomonas syringae pv. syringae]|nr:hypothetical protein AO354_07400 [Pseudomonas syringae pv. syringae]